MRQKCRMLLEMKSSGAGRFHQVLPDDALSQVFLAFQGIIYFEKAVMAALGDLSAPHSFEHRTAILLGMRAAAVQALTEIRPEFPERLWQLVFP